MLEECRWVYNHKSRHNISDTFSDFAWQGLLRKVVMSLRLTTADEMAGYFRVAHQMMSDADSRVYLVWCLVER